MLWRRLALFGSIVPATRRTGAGSRSYSFAPYEIFSLLLLKERIVFLNGPIFDDTTSVIVAQLLFLKSEDHKLPIHLYINSLGGAVTVGLAIYDMMQYIRAPISTICLGQAAAMSSLLLAAGAPGKRRAYPHSSIMIHQPSGVVGGQATDMAIQAKELRSVHARLNKIYSGHIGQPIKRIDECIEREMFMTPEEAKAFGLIDEVVQAPSGFCQEQQMHQSDQ
ncbi:uncharacterized protein LOC141812949 [Curcuma longa]|uniref:uncharacterized protein LOC141812949 n=1 Tax=Curcuma longa TaxID=136217 RepID=UPI003D9F8E64